MALASGLRMYTPPKSVAAFERRNMFLPALYAAEGDAILMLYGADEDAFGEISERRPDLRLLCFPDLKGLEEPLSPWGWNLSLRTMLAREGYPEAFLPSEETLACWRTIAHRRTALKVCGMLGFEAEWMPREFTVGEEAERYVASRGDVMLKMPWSSSGRGILAVRKGDGEKAARRIRDCIASQGSVLVEPFYDNACDFATEWESDGKTVIFKGFSMFETDGNGRYRGNLVASQDVILERLSNYAPIKDIQRVPTLLQPILTEVLLRHFEVPYVGPFGVDGLIDTHRKIVPCIEVNLRRTMGHVALDAYASGYENPFLCVQ